MQRMNFDGNPGCDNKSLSYAAVFSTPAITTPLQPSSSNHRLLCNSHPSLPHRTLPASRIMVSRDLVLSSYTVDLRPPLTKPTGCLIRTPPRKPYQPAEPSSCIIGRLRDVVKTLCGPMRSECVIRYLIPIIATRSSRSMQTTIGRSECVIRYAMKSRYHHPIHH